MGTDYRLDVYDTSGSRQAVITDFLNIAYTTVVNAPGVLSLGISGEHALLSSIADKWQIEVWRRPDSQSWNREFTGIFRDLVWAYKEKSEASLKCPGLMSMLRWRVINWATGTIDRSSFTTDPAETIMKMLVDYNAGANALVSNGRKRDGVIAGVSVEADGANGNSRNWYCHGRNLLENLQELALVAGGDFDLIKTSATTYQFRWYTGQRGTDRSATVTFGMEYGNMGSPTFAENKSGEKTVACVWGQGEKASRNYVTRTGDNYSASNDIELYVDARDVDLDDTTGLNTRGDGRLKEVQAASVFDFNTIRTPSTEYGVDYFLGDKVTAINPFNGEVHTLKIASLSVTMNDKGEEKVEPEFTSVY